MTLFLQMQIGSGGYLLEAKRIAQVLPLVDIKELPHAPRGVVGAFNYHGTPVPVIDLSQLALGRPTPRQLSSRLILVPVAIGCGPSEKRGERLLGLIAENVTETLRCDTKDFAPAGVRSDAAPHIGPVIVTGGRMLQWIDVAGLLPREVSDALFGQLGGHA
jgi:chemotaxis-related protein WspB